MRVYIKAAWTMVVHNLKLLWQHFSGLFKQFWNGGPIKMTVDSLIALIIVLIAPTFAVAFASGCFFGGDGPFMEIMFGVSFGVLLALLSMYCMEIVVVLCAVFIASATRRYLEVVLNGGEIPVQPA